MKHEPATKGVKGEIPLDLHRAIRKWMIDTDYTWEQVMPEAIGLWAQHRDIAPKPAPLVPSAAQHAAAEKC